MHHVGLMRQLRGFKGSKKEKGEAIKRLKQVNFSFKRADLILRLH